MYQVSESLSLSEAARLAVEADHCLVHCSFLIKGEPMRRGIIPLLVQTEKPLD